MHPPTALNVLTEDRLEEPKQINTNKNNSNGVLKAYAKHVSS